MMVLSRLLKIANKFHGVHNKRTALEIQTLNVGCKVKLCVCMCACVCVEGDF